MYTYRYCVRRCVWVDASIMSHLLAAGDSAPMGTFVRCIVSLPSRGSGARTHRYERMLDADPHDADALANLLWSQK